MLTIRNLCFSHTGRAPWLFHDLSFSIPAGAYVSVTGGNGTGKTTLLRLILGLLAPVSGRLSCQSRRTGYVPQQQEANPGFPITAEEMVDSYRRLLRLPDRDETRRALSLAGMEPFRKHLMGSLSGGQRQRLFIARALLGTPDLLLLDEVSTGIDEAHRERMYALLRRLSEERGVTILSVEHDLARARSQSDFLLALRGGQCTLSEAGCSGKGAAHA